MVGSAGAALDEIQDFFHARQNCFPELEAAAEEIWSMGGLEPGNLSRGLTDYLDRELTIRVKVMPVEVMGPTRRRYDRHGRRILRSEEHTSELQSLMRISYAVFCLKKKKTNKSDTNREHQ